MTCVICLRLTPVWLYGLFCLLFLPDACAAIWHLCCVFHLMPSRLNGMCCLFVYSLYMFCFIVYPCLMPPRLVAGLSCLRLTPPWLYWHSLFVYLLFVLRLKPPRLYGIDVVCCFAWCPMAIWHVLFDIYFRLSRYGYTAFVVYSAWRLRGYMAFLCYFAWCLRG